MKKRLISLLLAFAMVVCMIPGQALAAETAAIDNSNLALNGNGYAVCPVCEENVKWTEVSGELTAIQWLQKDTHYYLSGNVTYTGTDYAFCAPTTAGNTACLHLNGNNITATAGKAISGAGGNLNIMGNGTVSGNYATAWSGGATIHTWGNGTLSLYGGTYIKPTANTTANPILYVGAQTVNLYADAVIDGTGLSAGSTATCVVVENSAAVFNMYGGTVKNGTSSSSGGNIRVNSGGKVTVSGGTVTGGTATYYGGNIHVENGTLELTGGKIEQGTVRIQASTGAVSISGDPVVSELDLRAGVTATVGTMTAGASVGIRANGTFTNDAVANYANYFHAATATDALVENSDGTLRYFSNAALSFASGTTAYCPACQADVTWSAISGELTSTKWLQADGHYFLSDDVTYAGTDQALYSPTGSVAKTACLHLNGHNITATAGKAIQCGDGTVNIMGNGIVSGNGTTYGGATIHTWGSGNLNLYGGIYTKGASQYPVIFLNAFTVNLYDGITIEGEGTTPSYYALVYTENANAVVNMYGGAIQNGNSIGTSGNVKLYQGTFNMMGGTVQNGTGNTGGNIHVYNTGKVNLSGGTIKNGSVYAAASDALTLSGAPVIDALVIPADITVKVGTLTDGAQISISDDCAVTTDADLQAYVDAGYFVTTLEGKIVAVEDGALVIADAPVEEPEVPEDNSPTYILGDVLYETDFESDTVGALPAGWSAGYSEGSAEDGTLTNFGWGSGGKMTAQVESYGDYGNVFHFTSGNNDAFAAMGQIPTVNYLYEAEICVDYGYGSFGLANNYYAPAYEANGALFSSIYPKGDAAKYTYKGAGLSGSNPWTTSYSPASGDIVTLQILSLNGQNYIMYDGQIVAQCAARLQGKTVDHPGFYTCYGGIYVLGVKVTEVFAADVQLDAARVCVSKDAPATVQVELGFDKDQGLYTEYASSDSSKLSFGVVVAAGEEDVSAALTQDTQDAMVISFGESDKTENDEKIVCSTALVLTEADYETHYSVRPFVEIDGICFYGDGAVYMPAELANGAYLSATESGKALIAEVFGNCESFTADGNKEVTFTLFSDFHYIAGMYPATISDLKTILKRADDTNSAFVLSAGDFTNDMKGSPELYNTYRNYVTEEGKVLPAYNVYGNHELEFGNSMEDVTWTLTNDENTDHTVVWGSADGDFDANIGYYYFESEGFRIIGLDSEHSFNPTTGQWEHNRTGSSGAPSGNLYAGSLGPVQLAWLEEVLMDAAGKDIPCIIVAHDGFSGLGWATTSPDSEAIRALYAKANAANPGTVLMSINGHIHTDHQGWNEGVFYMDTNTVRNNWWQETAVDHYTDEHTFMFEEYDDEGNLIATYEKPYNTLTMGAKTWFSADPISCTVTISDAGIVSVDGVESDWAYGIVPTAASTVSGVECEITSGMFWDCARDGHIELLVTTETEYYTVCTNTQCGYESVHRSHNGIALQLADGTVSFPTDSAAAVAAQLENTGSCIKLLKNGITVALPDGKTVCVDVNGKQATITGSGTLLGMDSANDSYELSTGKATVADTVTVQPDVTVNGKRYIALTENASATFHRLEMRVNTVTLRTNEEAGLYYKAQYKCDDALAAAVNGYGVALSVHDMPDASFADDGNFTYNDGAKFVPNEDHVVNTNSGGVFGILKTGNDKDTNRKNLMTEIYANAYILIGEDVFIADTVNGGEKVGVAYSLYEVLKAINDKFDSYQPAVQALVAGFYNTWNQYVDFTADFTATTDYSGEMTYNYSAEDLQAIAAKAEEA